MESLRILFLQISDLHLKSMSGVNEFQLKKIGDAVHAHGSFDALLIILSGDLAFSGENDQYVAVTRLKDLLISAIKSSCLFDGKIEIVCVPGNHDIAHGDPAKSGMDLLEIRKENSYEKYVSSELMKQRSFFAYAKRCRCFSDSWMFHQKVIEFEDFSIEVNLLNTAMFSLKIDEDKGLHYLPRYCFNSLCTPTGADFVISIMHHSPDWLVDEQKNELEPLIFTKSSVVFLGHEHNLCVKSISYEEGTDTIIQAGGCLCNDDDWSDSAFHIGLFDSGTREYVVSEYCWNTKEKQYESKKRIKKVLPYKPSEEKKPIVQNSYMSALLSDPKRELSESFLDYFVFPRVFQVDSEKPTNKEFVTEESFCAEILSNKQVIVMGGYNAGKTTLLKKIFLSLSKKYVVIFCGIENIRGKRADRILKECFEDIYGENPSDFCRFQQISKEKKILIIEDIDQIATADFERFVKGVQGEFECLIFSSRFTLDINLLERMKEILNTKDAVTRYRLAPFFADKRAELVRSAVKILTVDQSSVPRITRFLTDAITAQRRFISLDPDFILKYAECYCKNIGDIGGNDSSVFSKVFEASIINALCKFQTNRISVDKIIMILARIAHHIHFKRVYPIQKSAIEEIIRGYSKYYGSEVDSNEAISIMTKSKILILDGTDTYRFSNNNYLAFFVAKEVNRQYYDTGDETDLEYLLTYACFGINSDILLFISYITDNTRILKHLIDVTCFYTIKSV